MIVERVIEELPQWPPGFKAWVDSRPEVVRKLCYEFPLGCRIKLDGVMHYMVGYNEGEKLILSPINPAEDYDGAHANKVYLCAHHLRPATEASPEHKHGG